MAKATYYKAEYNKQRMVSVEHSDNEAPSKLWKSGLILDQIIVRATGRTNWSMSNFKKNISYDLSDFVTNGKRTHPLPIEIEFEEGDAKGIATDVVIPTKNGKRYVLRQSIQETYDAIVAVDKIYTKLGGGMKTQLLPLHKNPELLKKLWELLTQIKEENKQKK